MTDTDAALSRFYAVIPAGGVGSRLWPLSRADAPKFLQDLTGTGKSLLRETWDRLVPVTGPSRVMVVTGRAHRSKVEEQIPELEDSNIVLEADPRDSTVAIALAAAILERREPGVIIGSFAADHVISRVNIFHQAVKDAVLAADAGYIVTIGINPTEPSIGFGYIHEGEPLQIPGVRGEVRHVVEFVEKPDRKTVQAYLAEGCYRWNAGMFVARASVLLEQLAETKPQLHTAILKLAQVWDEPPARARAVDRLWPSLEKVAIDYSVAEPAAAGGRMAVVAGGFDWDDVGDFASLAKLNSGGRPGNLAILGENARILADSSSGIVVSQSKRVVSLVGVRDIVVVDTPDALLVTTTANAQRVKSVVDALRLAGSTDVI